MTWNYRIIHYKAGGFGLHEVFYDERGQIEGWTEDPIDFGADDDEGSEGIVKSLEMALADCEHHPVLEEQDMDDALGRPASRRRK